MATGVLVVGSISIAVEVYITEISTTGVSHSSTIGVSFIEMVFTEEASTPSAQLREWEFLSFCFPTSGVNRITSQIYSPVI